MQLNQNLNPKYNALNPSLGDEGRNRLTAVLNFGVFNGPKQNSNSTNFIQRF